MERNDHKPVLFIAGGEWQVPFVTFLKGKGHPIVLVDPYPDSPCVPLADEFIRADVKEVDHIYELVHGRKFQFVLSDQTDVAVKPVARLAEKLGVAVNPVASVLKFSDKDQNRAFISEIDPEKCPAFRVVASAGELREFFSIHPDLIVKPVDSQSSRGIHRMLDAGQAGRCFDAARQASPQGRVIAEEYMAGREITVEGICLNAKHTSLTSSDKVHFKTGIASDLAYPSQLDAGLLREVFAFNDLFVERSGLKAGLTHAEYMVDDESRRFRLVEIACRGGGTLIPSDIVPWVTGVAVYEKYYACLCGDESTGVGEMQSRCALMHFFNFPAGKVRSIAGLDEINAMPEVLTCRMSFKEGTVLKEVTDDRGRHGFVIILAETRERIKSVLDAVVTRIQVTHAD